jgi:radical SAM superfamily enzyme YgiQ (UPF0313 family)
VYDVSAYGFWSTPLGMLYIGAILRKAGMRVTLLDCLIEQESKRKADGRAPFVKERVANPEAAKGLPQTFRRYGMSPEEVALRLAVMEPPDLVLVTCAMTYWYQGAAEIVGLIRKTFPASRIAVGGTYPALCGDHARKSMSGADLIVGAEGLDGFYALVEEVSGIPLAFRPGRDDIADFPYPAFDLYRSRSYVPLLTSIGCLYECTYCATPFLRRHVVRRDPKSVIREILHWNDREIYRFVLYDDAFLAQAADYAKPMLRIVARAPRGAEFYNPNAVNVSLIDRELAELLHEAGFQEVRLGLESADPAVQKATGGKVNRRGFETAVNLLFDAGFRKSAIQTYILAGLPLQKWEEAKRSVDYAADLGVKVHLAQYTPIPHTPMFEKYKHLARYPITEEPLFQNNALFPFSWEGFTDEDMNHLKSYVRERNETNDPRSSRGYGPIICED